MNCSIAFVLPECSEQRHDSLLTSNIPAAQGAFRKVASEADACAKSLTGTLRERLQSQAGDAAECVQLMQKLGEPIENLQVSKRLIGVASGTSQARDSDREVTCNSLPNTAQRCAIHRETLSACSL